MSAWFLTAGTPLCRTRLTTCPENLLAKCTLGLGNLASLMLASVTYRSWCRLRRMIRERRSTKLLVQRHQQRRSSEWRPTTYVELLIITQRPELSDQKLAMRLNSPIVSCTVPGGALILRLALIECALISGSNVFD